MQKDRIVLVIRGIRIDFVRYRSNSLFTILHSRLICEKQTHKQPAACYSTVSLCRIIFLHTLLPDIIERMHTLHVTYFNSIYHKNSLLLNPYTSFFLSFFLSYFILNIANRKLGKFKLVFISIFIISLLLILVNSN